jgi:NAD-dependent deacetylase
LNVRESARVLAGWLRESDNAIALTGAGVSTDSGIPDFRSTKSGLWAHHDPMKVASIEGFRADPAGFYEFWRKQFGATMKAVPNLTHRVLAALEERGLLRAVITQNIDGLHQRSGSKRVLEVHGNWHDVRCLRCGTRSKMATFLEELGAKEAPHCASCGGLIKPEVVLFGESLTIDFDEAERLTSSCDLLLAMGTSMEVWPAAGLGERALRAGARFVIVNREETSVDDQASLVIRGELAEISSLLARELGLSSVDLVSREGRATRSE